jgi:hypothetical protein
MSEQNIFQQACLLQLSTSCWQGQKTLESSVIESRFTDEQSQWLSGRKFLVSPDSLAKVRAVVSRARVFIDKLALPFPVTGLALVPKEMLTRIDNGLEGIRAEFFSAVGDFISGYEGERREAEKSLGELFNEADYPVDISSKFKLEWRFLTLDVPGKSRILPPEVYEREKAKFTAMMEETRELAVNALREGFAGLVHHILDRLSGDNGKPKRFKSSMVEKMQDFVSGFEDRNLFDDEGLADLVSQAKAIVSGVSPESLREDPRLRQRISSKMDEIKNAIDNALEDLPRRKIRLAA